MLPSIDEQVVKFYDVLFDSIFSESFQSRITQPLRRRAVIRQIQESADAASQSLTRFFLNQQLTEQQVADILEGFAALDDLLKLDDIANPNVTPEAVVDELLTDLPCPEAVLRAGNDAVYRVALHSVVQVLMLVGPVMAEWQKLNFSSTFELPRRVVNRLNQISEQMDAMGRSGQAAADERYELTYRDYLLQRFHRVEVGTVRMTTNLAVDLRELFVMPRVLARPRQQKTNDAELTDSTAFMNLATARKFFGVRSEHIEPTKNEKEEITTALNQVKRYPRNVIVGAPGSGKSTFLEWLQLKLAAVEEVFVLAEQQAIPMLLRVRQLNPRNLPRGAELIEKATASKDRAALMPLDWLDRQMEAGRVLFMLDGLDETEPELRDRYVIPWLRDLCRQYPNCHYLVSSRPVGYPPGILRALEFVECDLLDFGEPQVSEYTRHWCTAVRLARNEPEEEARREGTADGGRIVDGFKNHPYICNLARNPLMLSAICLVNYFEGGHLPEDRALLYKLCVEGLLHHWDQRRGIHSEFAFDEKLRACREVAMAMQVNDMAEYESEKVQEIFTTVLGEHARAEKLLEHIRYRTGLLLERRPGAFAFAHLTFQEYLAARAVHEGNRFSVDVDRLAREHDDSRWQEVIPLYCGLVPTPAARDIIERLIAQPDTLSLSEVLVESYFSSGPELSKNQALRRKVLERIAIAPSVLLPGQTILRFPTDEVAPIANLLVGKIESNIAVSEALYWLNKHPKLLDVTILIERLQEWRKMKPIQVSELFYLLHTWGPDKVLAEIATAADIYAAPGPMFSDSPKAYGSQAEIALIGLADREIEEAPSSPGFEAALLRILCTLLDSMSINLFSFEKSIIKLRKQLLQGAATRLEFASLARRLAEHLVRIKGDDHERSNAIATLLNSLADSLEGRKFTKSKTIIKRTKKNRPKRR